MSPPKKRYWPFATTRSGINKRGSDEIVFPTQSLTSNRGGRTVVAMNVLTATGYTIAGRYEILDILGGGTFGKVLKALDLQTNTQVALKVTKDYGSHLSRDGRREMEILKKLNMLDKDDVHHIVRFIDGFYWRQRFCIAFELLPMTLAMYLEHKKLLTGMNGMPIRETAVVVDQLLNALQFLSRFGIIHCDLKPDNVMLTDVLKSDVKLIDFGSYEHAGKCPLTYLQTRHYRSPEVILGVEYGCPIDMWSLGCIAAQCHTGRVLFPGGSEVDQLYLIMEVFGVPPNDFLQRAARVHKFFNRITKRAISSYVPYGPPKCCYHPPASVPLKELMSRPRHPCERRDSRFSLKEKSMQDLIELMLVYDPKRRGRPELLRKHPFFEEIRKNATSAKRMTSEGIPTSSPST